MLMLKAVRTRALLLLWAGQAFSNVGDEIYRVAVIWLAVGLIGADAGYLAAAQSGALFALCLVGGHWADRWDHRRTMIAVDVARAFIVLIPVAAYYAGRVTLAALVVMAVAVAALSAFFDPALQATLPSVSPDYETLQAATGLMGTTNRLARAVGPGVVGLLGGLVPMIHFFTLDAATFAVSALSVSRILPPRSQAVEPPPDRTLWGSMTEGIVDLWRRPLLRELMLVRVCVSALWGVAFSLGLALAVHDLSPGAVTAFGKVVACYGAGNVLGALFVGNIRRRRPLLILFGGLSVLGSGFAAMVLCKTASALGAVCLFAAVGGPVNDVPFYDIVQREYPVEKLAGVFRLKLALETASLMLLTAASPPLFRAFGPRAVLCACGVGIGALGAAGLLVHAERRPAFTVL